MYVLGLSFNYHDSAAVLLKDGEIVAAAQEERFSRIKHDAAFPARAIVFCLKEAGILPSMLDAVVYYEDTLQKLDRVVTSFLEQGHLYPDYLRYVTEGWGLGRKFEPLEHISEHLRLPLSKVHYIPHHLSHAASAWLTSPFDEATVVTMDGVGEYETTTVSVARGNRIERLYSASLPESLGLLYSAFTAFLGFEVNEGEYKVMGMAGFGEPLAYEKLRSLIELTPDGLFKLDQRYFSFRCPRDLPYTQALRDLFGIPRKHGADFRVPPKGQAPQDEVEASSQHYANIAASLQTVTEEAILHVVGKAVAHTGISNVVIAGGVGLNSLANARVQRELGVKLFVQPAAGDAGSALGAALHHYHCTLGHPRKHVMVNPYLGAEYSDDDIEEALTINQLKAVRFDDQKALIDAVVERLVRGEVIGWMQGRFEWGPRALGNRSILANPTRSDMQAIVNLKIKFREPFRPFAPSVLAEHAAEYFDFSPPHSPSSPEHFMLAVGRVKEEQRQRVPAVTHVDGTARVHLVRRDTAPLFYDLIAAFGRQTGVPVLLNTSFNLKNEAVVDKPYDALETFAWSEMDALVMGRYLLLKENFV